MGSIIIPKHTAETVYFDAAMHVLASEDSWILMTDFTNRLFEYLVEIGKETKRSSDNTHYTKCAQLPMYFGFVERNIVSGKTYLRINEKGREFLKAITEKDSDTFFELLVESIEAGNFGELNMGVPSSRSDVDPPALFIRASYDLNGLTNKEFAFLIWSLVDRNDDYTGSVKVIEEYRKQGSWELNANANIYKDCKPIMLLQRWGFLTSVANGIAISSDIDQKYRNRLLNLKIYSVDRNTSSFLEESVKSLEKDSAKTDKLKLLLNIPRQRITYGAPGTGKSHGIADITKNEAVLECFRTTFHPDSDYSTFVGAYKPVMSDGRIEYRFRPQAFMKAYVKAWREMADAKKEGREGKNVVLVIEEINRGNCAQIFGDLFQLLDRGNSGYSCYPIDADTDLAEWLKDEKQLGVKLEVLEIPADIEEKEWKKVKILEKLALPPNLYIWATMNTSDQSLFPIDSAFKRRWDWKYVPISKPDNLKDRKIEVGDNLYDWWDFIQLMNKYIKDASESEDKQLGYFFVKADDATGYISVDAFANKVLFYLYGDAFKSYPLPDCFEKANKELLTFGEFFYREKVEENGKTSHKPGDVKLDVLKAFLDKIHDGEKKIGVISKKQGENKKESAASETVKDSSTTKEQPELFNQ